MQIKVVIGTIAFMLTMMIMGFAALREPARLEEYSRAFEGRSIESGARIFAGNCATCHGVNGKGEECYDTGGSQIGCRGLPLNYAPLLCGDTSDRTPRMNAMNWASTKEAFIESVVAAGRAGTAMPVWAAQFDGPMRQDEINNVVAFILNWESEELCSAPVKTFEWPATVESFLTDFMDGDAVNGETLFATTYGCSGCHGIPDGSVPASIGPDLSNIAAGGAMRIEGYTAHMYVYESILDPNAFIAEECPTGPCLGPPSAMPANFVERMAENPQDMADILAYLLGEPVGMFAWPTTAEQFLADFPDGDAANGAALFVTYGCAACHGDPPEDAVPATVGPELDNIAVDGATRVEGYTAEMYVYESILNPNALIAEDCAAGPCVGPPSLMPSYFPEQMSDNPQDMADILAYLLGQ